MDGTGLDAANKSVLFSLAIAHYHSDCEFGILTGLDIRRAAIKDDYGAFGLELGQGEPRDIAPDR